jgi:hypothetical protein
MESYRICIYLYTNSVLMKTLFNLSCILLLNFLLFNTLRTSAQNFKAVKTDASYYYYDSVSKEIISARIDSTAISGSENQYFGMRQIRQTDYGCYIPNGASWLGDLVTENPNGVFKFIVYPFSPSDSADIFTINSQALIGNYWHFYNYHSINEYVEAKVTQIIPATFIGISDTVKTISLQRKSASGQNINDPINSQKILLSKNYGLIRLPKFDEYRTTLKFFDLCGKTNPTMGRTNLTFNEIFDFQVGDELHIKQHYSNYNYPTSITDDAIIHTIIEKIPSNSLDTLKYKVAECRYHSYSYGNEHYIYSYFNDTIVENYTKNNYISLGFEPSEPYISNSISPEFLTSNGMGTASVDSMLFNGVPWKTTNQFGLLWHEGNPNCWQQATIDVCVPQLYYYSGLGGPYYYCWDFFSWYLDYSQLVYYKKGSQTWGTPLNCETLLHTSLQDNPSKQSLNIFPNPTSGKITITVPQSFQMPCKLEIFDLTDRVIKEIQLTELSQSFDLYNYPSGLYTYKIIAANREVFRGKIIKQ